VSAAAPEVSWGWPEICVALMWRLAPAGVVITRADLHALPMERVLLEDRRAKEMIFSWIPISQAKARLKASAPAKFGERATLSELQGRWQKIACVLMWKLAKDGITLTPKDLAAVPSDRILLAHGHADDIEYRFVPRAEAKRIQDWEKDNEGRIILERTQL
jgi:hypothetical protein